jgi:alpha-L-fucosidase
MLLAAALTVAMAAPTPDVQRPDDPRMAWWREAKFGLFIHWGLYAVPAGEWNGVKTHGEWIRDTARIPVGTYEQFLSQFNPVKFDPDEWVRIAKDAGMKYVVITSKHHDGFALYDSKYTDWDVASTPYKRDILRMLADACKKQGLRFCTYHSIMDWHHPDYLPRRPWEAADRPAAGADFKRFVEYLHRQVEEIATQYDPGIMWFDGQWESTWNTELGKDLLDLCRRVRPNMIVNNRVLSGPQGGGDYLTPEQEIPEEAILHKDWETCMTMNRNWGYNRADLNYKSTKDIIRMLCDIASKGGNFLLNVGPTAEGLIPPDSVQRLKQVGAWMRVNGDSIYGTTASPFGRLPWGRCTAKARGANSSLFLHIFDWPEDGRLRLPGLGNEIVSAIFLDGAAPAKVTHDGTDVILSFSGDMPDELATVLELRLKGLPVVYKAPEILADSAEFVRVIEVSLEAPGLDIRYTLDGSDPTGLATTYRAPIRIGQSASLKARAFHGGKPVSGVSEMRFEKVVPIPAEALGGSQPGLELRVYSGTWDKLPKLEGVTNFVSRQAPAITLSDDPLREFTARLFRGYIEVGEDELYRFALSSDDGSKLWIDGRLVVDNDGLHGAVEKSGAMALAKGKHKVQVAWFNKTGGAQLSLKWAKLGNSLEEVPPAAFFQPISAHFSAKR